MTDTLCDIFDFIILYHGYEVKSIKKNNTFLENKHKYIVRSSHFCFRAMDDDANLLFKFVDIMVVKCPTVHVLATLSIISSGLQEHLVTRREWAAKASAAGGGESEP